LIILSKYPGLLKGRSLKSGLLLIFLAFFLQNNTYAQSREYTLKAVYIEKFTRFTNWPPGCGIENKEEPFSVYVLGNQAFSKTLKNIFSIQKIYQKPVEVNLLDKWKEMDACHILYISGDYEEELSEILEYIKGRSVLTISDTEGFAEKGVIINFYIERNKLRFEVNETALHESPLEMNFFLLDMAKIVDPLKK